MKRVPCVTLFDNENAIERVMRRGGLTRQEAIDAIIRDSFERYMRANAWVPRYFVRLAIRDVYGTGVHYVFHGGDFIPSVINAPTTRHHYADSYLNDKDDRQ